MMLAGIGLWSCNADEYDAIDGTGNGQSASDATEMTFKASMGGSLSKSTMTMETGETAFEDSDCIKVFNLNNDAAKFSVTNISGDGSQAIFGGEIATTKGYYAMLPYQDNAAISNGEITMTIPTEQTYEYQDLMVGYTDNTDRVFRFRHVGTMIQFVTRQKYESITIESADGVTPIAGDVKVKIGADGKPQVTGGTATKITIKCDKTLSSANVLATLMPLNGVKLKFGFKLPNSSTIPQEIEAKTLESGVMYTYDQVGKYKITCYKDGTNSEVLFTRYTSDINTKNGQVRIELPECPLQAPQGMAYAYATEPEGAVVYKPNTIKTTKISADIVLYPVLNQAVTFTIYCNGNDQTPVVKEIGSGVYIQLPEITAVAEEGFRYGYTTTEGGDVQYQSGDKFSSVKNETLYLAKQKINLFKVYFNGPDQEPKTYQVASSYDASFTLPALNKREGYFAGYGISASSDEFMYYPGDVLYINDISIFDYYAVYRKNEPISDNVDYSFNGATLGDPTLSGNEKTYMQTLPQIPEGACMVIKFTNHCKEASTIDTKFNSGIRLCGTQNVNSASAKDIEIFNSNWGQKSGTYPAKDYYMANINNAEVTVRIYNHGGVADVEYLWTGSIDGKSYKIMYSNICIWDNLYVSVYAYKSYIEFAK